MQVAPEEGLREAGKCAQSSEIGSSQVARSGCALRGAQSDVGSGEAEGAAGHVLSQCGVGGRCCQYDIEESTSMIWGGAWCTDNVRTRCSLLRLMEDPGWCEQTSSKMECGVCLTHLYGRDRFPDYREPRDLYD